MQDAPIKESGRGGTLTKSGNSKSAFGSAKLKQWENRQRREAAKTATLSQIEARLQALVDEREAALDALEAEIEKAAQAVFSADDEIARATRDGDSALFLMAKGKQKEAADRLHSLKIEYSKLQEEPYLNDIDRERLTEEILQSHADARAQTLARFINLLGEMKQAGDSLEETTKRCKRVLYLIQAREKAHEELFIRRRDLTRWANKTLEEMENEAFRKALKALVARKQETKGAKTA